MEMTKKWLTEGEANADFEKSIKFHDGKRMRVKVVAANYSSKVIGRV